jgi:hypothetical protein
MLARLDGLSDMIEIPPWCSSGRPDIGRGSKATMAHF